MPTVSVLVSVYRSEATLERSLEAIRRQSFRDFEVVIVDSGPDEQCERIVADRFSEFRYFRASHRLSADAARNYGLERSHGKVVASTDPDAYPRQDWLERLVAAHDQSNGLIIGGVACYGQRWLDLGAHLCKFGRWLPGGPARQVDDGPTVNLLVSKQLLDRVGGKLGGIHGDTDLCWRIRAQGGEIWLNPDAVVEHHHRQTWRSLMQERHERGRQFGVLWLSWHPMSGAGRMWRLFITLLPLRLLSQLTRVARNAAQAEMLGAYIRTLPVVASGLYAWLLGEAGAFLGLKPDTDQYTGT